MLQSDKYRTAKIALCAVIFLVTLYFGFKPKGFRFHNQAEWLKDKSALSFTNIGMAYSQQTLEKIGVSDAITLIATLKPYRTGRQLSKVFSVIDKDGNELLACEQWQKGLTITLWDASRNRIGRIGFSDALSVDSKRFVAATVSSSEIRMFLEASPGLWKRQRIMLPPAFWGEGRLILGMSATGRHPWHGEITGLALFNGEKPEEQICAYAKAWRELDSLDMLAGQSPAALFLFDALEKENIPDRSGSGWNLHVPLYPRIFKFEVLRVLPDINKINRGLAIDIAINLLGFMPLGGCIYIMLLSLSFSGRKATILTVVCAVAVSLGIELLQSLIPTRSSQLFDVFFNGAGAWCGVVAVRLLSTMLPQGKA